MLDAVAAAPKGTSLEPTVNLILIGGSGIPWSGGRFFVN